MPLPPILRVSPGWRSALLIGFNSMHLMQSSSFACSSQWPTTRRGAACACLRMWRSEDMKQTERTSTRMTDTLHTEVLVVGAGPVGLTLALDLARRGIACRIIEQAPTYQFGTRG